MDVKIYLGDYVELPNSQFDPIPGELTPPYEVNNWRYSLEFTDNPVDGTTFSINIKKNGSIISTITKTFSSSISDASNILIGATHEITAETLAENLVTYNVENNTEYSVSPFGLINLYGCRNVYIDVLGSVVTDDVFGIQIISNTTSIIINSPIISYTFESEDYIPDGSSGITPSTGTTIYETFNLLDLYKDENIELTLKLADIEKLSNVFTDFSNSFTVPATPKNNELFKHYYDVDIDNTFNANIRIKGYIEIDSFPFRLGKIQLESIKLVDQRPDSYKITFFGSLMQLNDLFGDDTINILDYDKEIVNGSETLVKNRSILSQFDYNYSSANFINSINLSTFKDGNVITPLISYTDRDWNYRDGAGSPADDLIDISVTEGAINDNELRPALRIKFIMDAIQAKYGITFSSEFIESATFKNLFMWMNGNTIITAEVIDLLLSYYEQNDSSLYYSDVSIADNIFSFTDTGYDWEPGNFYNLTTYVDNITLKNGDSAVGTEIVYELLNLDNEVIFTETKVVTNVAPYVSFNYYIDQSNGVPVDYAFKFRIRCADDIVYGFSRLFLGNNFGTGPYDTVIVRGYSNLLIKPESNLPNMKVIDFFTGIMKMFKLVIRPISETEFYLNTLNGFYADGNILDITQYTNQKEVNIERPLIYSNIMFNYEKTNNVLGKKFRETYDLLNDEIGYGDLKSNYSSVENKAELKVKLPFENMLFERLTNLNTGVLTNIIIGQSITTTDYKTFSKNNSKPILFFNNGLNSHTTNPIKVRFGTSGVATVTYSYNVGNTNDEFINQVTDTINWGAEIDPWHQQIVANSLYLNYWSDWINTIYDLKQRKFTYEAYLPPRYIEELSLNDRLVIGNNRYKINDYKINLNTGKTMLTLFNDIFEWSPYSVGDDSALPTLVPEEITANPSIKYYSVNIIKNKPWTLSKVDTGYGTSWITLDSTSGNGSSEVVFRVEDKSGQVPPEVYLTRTMELDFVFADETITVTITQNGLTA